MSYSLSKALLCTAIASSFLFMSCQKAGGRSVKAKTGPGGSVAGKPVAAATVACSEEALKTYKELKDSGEKLKAALEKNKGTAPRDLGDAVKQELTALANDVADKSKKVIAAIEGMTVVTIDKAKNEKVQACIGVDLEPTAKPNAKKDYAVSAIADITKNFGTAVKDRTGIDNNITKPVTDVVDGKPVPAPAPAPAAPAFGDKDIFISADLADLLSDESQMNGESFISEGKVIKGADAYKLILENKTVTSCVATQSVKDIKLSGKRAKILFLDGRKTDETSKRIVLSLQLVVRSDDKKGQSLLNINCNIAESSGKEDVAAKKAIQTALGNLVSEAPFPLKDAEKIGDEPTEDGEE